MRCHACGLPISDADARVRLLFTLTGGRKTTLDAHARCIRLLPTVALQTTERPEVRLSA